MFEELDDSNPDLRPPVPRSACYQRRGLPDVYVRFNVSLGQISSLSAEFQNSSGQYTADGAGAADFMAPSGAVGIFKLEGLPVPIEVQTTGE
jgi:hypothetical protein